MHNVVRLILILGFAGSATTLLAGLWAWWNEEDRRLRRIARRALGGEPDAAIVARGRDSAAAFRLASAEVLVMRRGGANALLYPMKLLVGAELIIDGEVAARAVRDEPRRALDKIAADARRVTLRLIFDDAAHPDFELDLWLAEDALRRAARPPTAAIQEARGWLARAEAILRRPAPPIMAAPMSQPATAPARSAPTPVASESEDHLEADLDDDPPWDDDPAASAPPVVGPAAAAGHAAPRPRAREVADDDGEPIPPLDAPIQPYLL